MVAYRIVFVLPNIVWWWWWWWWWRWWCLSAKTL